MKYLVTVERTYIVEHVVEAGDELAAREQVQLGYAPVEAMRFGDERIVHVESQEEEGE